MRDRHWMIWGIVLMLAAQSFLHALGKSLRTMKMR